MATCEPPDFLVCIGGIALTERHRRDTFVDSSRNQQPTNSFLKDDEVLWVDRRLSFRRNRGYCHALVGRSSVCNSCKSNLCL